jgi:predicted solute-binding protein
MTYYERNKEAIKKQSREYYYKHRDKYLEYNREYFKTYYPLNEQKVKDRCRQYYINSSETYKEKRRKYAREYMRSNYIPRCRRNVKKDLTTQLNKTRKTIPKVNRLINIPVIYNEDGLILLEF